jgi:hypothetical protein
MWKVICVNECEFYLNNFQNVLEPSLYLYSFKVDNKNDTGLLLSTTKPKGIKRPLKREMTQEYLQFIEVNWWSKRSGHD